MTDPLPPHLRAAADQPPRTTDAHVFFFGYEGPEPECCFQQWYPSPFTTPCATTGKLLSFPTAEHYMMYHKALLMGDRGVAAQILAAPHPSEAKALGRKVADFDQERWDAECDAVVEQGNLLKFKQNLKLGGVLVGTGSREIVETSPDDRVWGVGFDTANAEANAESWGQNRLGKALMRVRETLRRDKLAV